MNNPSYVEFDQLDARKLGNVTYHANVLSYHPISLEEEHQCHATTNTNTAVTIEPQRFDSILNKYS